MQVRRILVPIRLDGKGENVLDHALSLGRAHNAHIEVVHGRPAPKDLIPFGVSVPSVLREQIARSGEDAAAGEEAEVERLFRAYAASRKLALIGIGEDHPRDKMSATWRVERGRQASIVSLRGRLADVVVVAQPEREGTLGHNTLESALFNSARLVLMCPDAPAPEAIGQAVALAWNGSREATRALAQAMPLLTAADKVSVLTVAGQELELNAGHVLRYLADHAVSATHVEVKAGDPLGGVLLKAAADAGADVLLMGAYGSSRGREIIFGGVTQHIVDTAHMPVLMAH